MSVQTETLEISQQDTLEAGGCQLIIFNDDVNTFDFVIDSLMEVCGHEPMQAEQCTIIIHFKGKCSVKEGEYGHLEPMCIALLDRGLSAAIH